MIVYKLYLFDGCCHGTIMELFDCCYLHNYCGLLIVVVGKIKESFDILSFFYNFHFYTFFI